MKILTIRIVALGLISFFSLLQLQAQSPFTLKSQYNGRYDFTMIGASLNKEGNYYRPNSDCDYYDLSQPPSSTLNLDSDQSVVAAFLYWSANTDDQSNLDDQVSLNQQPISSTQTNTYSVEGFNFYSCSAEITDMVQSQGNTDYTVTDFSLFRGGNCNVSYGGWFILIVYEDPNLNLNSVNIYEGFNGVSASHNAIEINFSNFLVIDPVGASLGIVAWEGDKHAAVEESVIFNGNILSNSINPSDNLFNGTNSFHMDSTLYNMDMDQFDVSGLVQVNDTMARVEVSSQADLALMNLVAFTTNNELPDPTVEITAASSDCENDEIFLTIDIHNSANDTLPRNTLVNIYFDEIDQSPEQQLYTTTDIPVGGSETLYTTLSYPSNNLSSLTIHASVNLDAENNPIFRETNPANNFDQYSLNFERLPTISAFSESNCLIDQKASFDLSQHIGNLSAEYPELSFSFYTTIENATNQIMAIGSTIEITEPTQIFLRYENPDFDCFKIAVVDLLINPISFQDKGKVIICPTTQFLLPDGTYTNQPGVYELYVMRPLLCDELVRIELLWKEIDYPNVFAPNGNGNNDDFHALPSESCIGDIENYQLTIYNRWGEKVFETNSFTEAWDGFYKGEIQEGLFLWYSTYEQANEVFHQNGSVQLIF